MKRTYSNPMIFLASTETDINNSQEGGYGTDWKPQGWDEYIADLGVYGEDWWYVTGFKLSDPTTYEAFKFNPNDPDTWENVIAYPD